MKKIKFFLFFLTFLWAFPLNAATNKPVVSKPSPEDWLVKKGQELVTILSEEDTKNRYLKLRKIAKEVFNKGEMTRLAMGRHWRTLSESQQADLQHLFVDYFVVSYGSTALGFSNVNIQVSEKQLSGKDILLKTLVDVKFSGTPQKTIEEQKDTPTHFEMLFALRETPEGFYIRDAKIEGQSILMFLRSQLESELKNVSFQVDVFLNKMREKINARYRAAEDLAKLNKNNTPT